MVSNFSKLLLAVLPVWASITNAFATPHGDSSAKPTPGVGGYRFSIASDIANLSNPITVSAIDSQGNVIVGFTGEVYLSIVRPEDAHLPVTPDRVTLSGAGWSGKITLPSSARLPVQLRATDRDHHSGDSMPFDVMRVLPLKTADTVWDVTRGLLYASVPAAGGIFANKVVAINPDSLQVVKSVTVGQDPRKLALTSGGEALYVALDANGTIARIEPGSMTVTSTFSVGADSDGPLYAEDLCPVAGQPEFLVASRYSKHYSGEPTVAAYKSGVMQPNTVSTVNRIEPANDPTIFFGYQTWSSGFTFRKMRLDTNGLSMLSESQLISGFSTDIRSDGNTVFSSTGFELDGINLARLGSFSVTTSGAVCPDLSANRVYFVDYHTSYTFPLVIKSFEPSTFLFVRELSLPNPIATKSFVRWGKNGLAIGRGDASEILFIKSNRLVPNDQPADLAVTVEADPDPAWVAQQLRYTVRVVNQGPNVANDVLVRAIPSDSQTLQGIHPSNGVVTWLPSEIDLSIGRLEVGESASLTLETLPSSAGPLFCKAVVSSSAVDPDYTNNSANKSLLAGFDSSPNTTKIVRLSANNLVYDPTRQLLWTTIHNQVDGTNNAFPENSLVAINPYNGLASDPVPINDHSVERSIAISPNGRYLYLGLYVPSQLLRVDLSSVPPTLTRIPLGNNASGEPMYAQDFEVLDGDGTSFLMTGEYDHGAVVYDGAVPRPVRTSLYSVSRIERTASPNVFIGYNNYTFPTATFALMKLSVTASGVSIVQSNSSLIGSYNAELRSGGNFTLASSGKLVDSNALTLRASLGMSGTPCLDFENGRAYILNGATLYAYDTTTGQSSGSLALGGTFYDFGPTCVRWGVDGIAVADNYGHLYLTRWSVVDPRGTTPGWRGNPETDQ